MGLSFNINSVTSWVSSVSNWASSAGSAFSGWAGSIYDWANNNISGLPLGIFSAAAQLPSVPIFGTKYYIPTVSDQDVLGVLSGSQWSNYTVSYSFPDSRSDYELINPSASGFKRLSNSSEEALHHIFNGPAAYGQGMDLTSLASFTNVNWVYTGRNDANLKLSGFIEGSIINRSHGYYPGIPIYGGDVWLEYGDKEAPLGGYNYYLLLHELGHGLGLKHPHDTGGQLPKMSDMHDSTEYTVMSYTRKGNPQTFMMYDILALQYLYGADYTANSGDTVYKWSATTGETFVNGVGQGTPGTNLVMLTIWDGGGTDTYDLSNYSTNLSVDLTPGGYSRISSEQISGTAHGNVYNAFQFNGDSRSLIENAIGGSGHDQITGNAANNVLTGNAGNDVLSGGEGHDRLDGGLDNDTLRGGNGDDYLTGGFGDDLLDDTDIGGTNIVFGNDTMEGGYGNDKLYGRFGNDRLYGDAGDDFIDAGEDNDLADGGDGNDTLIGWTGDDTLYGASGNDNLDAGDGNDWLYGGAGDDTLYAGAGTDFLLGGAGMDMLIGGDGWNGVAYWDYVAADGKTGLVINLQDSSKSTGDAQGDSYVRINGVFGTDYADAIYASSSTRDLYGGNGDDTLYGSEKNDRLDGQSGNDIVYGGAGDDVLTGGAGGDTLVGGAGADTLDGGAGWNVIGYHDAAAGVKVVRFDARLNTGDAAGDVYVNSSFAALVGSSHNDELHGWWASEEIYGGAGNDYINGYEGDDFLAGQWGDDTILGGWGNDRLLGEDGNDVLYGEAGNDLLNGGSGNDVIWAGAGHDNVNGEAGDDWLAGEDGNDSIYGGNGNDGVWAGTGDDTAYGDAGNDTLYGEAGNDTLDGGDGSDTIDGGADSDIIYGRAGDDSILGGDGNDWLFGMDGNDIILGGNGDDYIYGGIGSDTLFGENGNDILVTDRGGARMYGGAGLDVFRFMATATVNTIADFQAGLGLSDRIELASSLFTSFAAVKAAAVQSGNAVVITKGGFSLTLENVSLMSLAADDFAFI